MRNNKYLSGLLTNGSEEKNISILRSLIPGRVDSKQAGQILGFQEHDIPILISQRLLEPLGKPASNSVKYFATCHIEELAKNTDWLHVATQAIYDYWKSKNLRKGSQKSPVSQEQNEETSLAA